MIYLLSHRIRWKEEEKAIISEMAIN